MASPKPGVGSSSTAVSLFLVYQFLKRLVTPFNQWPAYIAGIIDENGVIIKKAKDRHTLDEKRSFSKFDLLVLKIKRIMEKVPGGKTRIASYAAALYLIKEDWKQNSIEEIESDEYFKKLDSEFTQLLGSLLPEAEGGAPTNVVGSGNIAGGGYRGPDDVKVSSRASRSYRRKNRTQKARPKEKDQISLISRQ